MPECFRSMLTPFFCARQRRNEMTKESLDTDNSAQKELPFNEEQLQFLKSWVGRIKKELKGSVHHKKRKTVLKGKK